MFCLSIFLMQKKYVKKLLKTPFIIIGNNKFKAFMNYKGYQDIKLN